MELGGPKLHALYVVKPWRTGAQVVFPIYDVVLSAIGFDKRDTKELLIARVHAPWVTFRVARPERVFPLPDVRFDEIVPAWPATATRQEDL